MKQMQRDPGATDRARRAERKADEKAGVISIKPVKLENKSAAAASTAAVGGGFRKGGFKSAFGGGEERAQVQGRENSNGREFRKVFAGEEDDDEEMVMGEGKEVEEMSEESEDEDFGYEYYDPMRPTGCDESCYGRH